MAREKLIPMSFYLPQSLHDKLKVAGANRKQSMLVRNAIQMIIDGHKEYDSGYNQGLKDAIEVIDTNEFATIVSVHGHQIKDLLISDVKT